MSVAQTELIYRKSANGHSDGGAMSLTTIGSGVDGDFWADVSDVNRIAGLTRYGKFFIFNNSGSDSLMRPVVWVYRPGDNLSTDQIGLGWDLAADSDGLQGNMTAFEVEDNVCLVSSASDTRTALIYGLDNLGSAQAEQVTLNGTTEVLTNATFTQVWGLKLSATGLQTVTVKEGAGGTTRGTIGANKVCCWLWLDAGTKMVGLALPSLVAQGAYGIWGKQVLPANLPGARPAVTIYAVEES